MRNLQEMKQYCHINRKFHFLEYCIYIELFHKQNITTQPLDKLIDQVNAILALIFLVFVLFKIIFVTLLQEGTNNAEAPCSQQRQ